MFRSVVFVLVAVAALQGQASQPEPPIKAQVLIQLEKKTYLVGEAISFHASLENFGSTPFYISKHLGMVVDNVYMPVAGVSDFYFTLQSKDKTWQSNDCSGGYGHAALFTMNNDEKKKAFLDLEFLLLEPHSFYGTQMWLDLCGKVLSPGDYTLTARYSPDTARALDDYQADRPILRNIVKSEPLAFTVLPPQRQKKR
jgi:hypothetical protein